MDKGADINAKNKDGDTPLIQATSIGGYKEIVELLISKGANVNAKDNIGNTSLKWASYFNREEIAELLVKNGADINAINDVGNTPLVEASKKGHKEITELLIRNGVNLPDIEEVRQEYFKLLEENTSKQMVLNQMLGVSVIEEKVVFSVVEETLREKYYISVNDMSKLREEASDLMVLARQTADRTKYDDLE